MRHEKWEHWISKKKKNKKRKNTHQRKKRTAETNRNIRQRPRRRRKWKKRTETPRRRGRQRNNAEGDSDEREKNGQKSVDEFDSTDEHSRTKTRGGGSKKREKTVSVPLRHFFGWIHPQTKVPSQGKKIAIANPERILDLSPTCFSRVEKRNIINGDSSAKSESNR